MTPAAAALRPLVPALLVGAALGLAGALRPAVAQPEDPAPAAAAPASPDLPRELRRVARAGLSPAERLASAERALRTPRGGEPDAWAKAALALAVEAPEASAWLWRRALEEGPVEAGLLERGRRADPVPDGSAELRALEAARGWVLGRREGDVCAAWPPGAFVAAVLADELGDLPAGAASTLPADEVRALLAARAPLAADLDRATALDPEASAAGLEALRARGAAALPALLHEAGRGARGVPPGRLDRVVKALAVLGVLGERAATPALIACLESPHGWVRFAAATALGDLRDPAAAVALARQVVYAGDPFRARESWDYPGTTETDVRPEDWPSVEYYVIDVAACDALLELGARDAAGWMLRTALDPRRRNLRIRVPQDALDALARHLPGAPVAAYEVESGLGSREQAFLTLARWWREHRDEPGLLRPRADGASRAFDEADPGFVRAARGLAERLSQAKVLELMIAKDVCELLGPPLTPTLTAALAQARAPGAKVELADALGRVRDPRAVPALLGLLDDKAGFVRASAARALGAYVRRSPEVQERLLALLDDRECGARLGALQSLANAPVSARVREAARTHGPEAYAERCGADAGYAMGHAVLLLVQEGEQHLPAALEGLAAPDRVVRRSWWDLLRLVLDLEERAYDWAAAPGSPGARAPDPQALRAALRARRGA